MGMASEYLVEVRDVNLVRHGQIHESRLDIKYVEVFRGVGAWEMKLPAEHPLLAVLKTKGSGIVITQLSSGETYSGRMQSCVLSQDAEDPEGTWLITGVDDNVIAAASQVLPDPANAADAQTTGYWNMSGTGEAVMKAAVNLNIGPGAIAAREYSWLSVAASLGRGANISTSARFSGMGDELTSMGIASGLGWKFSQQGASIVFDVFEPADKTGLIQLDIRNGGLNSTELGYSAPSATEVLVLGQGEGAERTVRRVTSTASLAEATAWGLRWETVKDQRNTDDPTELQQAGEEILTERGSTVHSLKVVPGDAPNQKLGVDWGLGDQITVIIDGSPAEAIVAEVATSITSAGVIKYATVGDPVGFDWEARVSARVREHDTRLSNLETLIDTASTPAPWDGGTSTEVVYRNLAMFSSYTGSGPLVVTTPVTNGNYMTRVKIMGQDYSTGSNILDLDVVFYAYAVDGNYYNYGAVSVGSREVSVVLGKNGSGQAVLLLYPVGPAWSIARAAVTEAHIGHSGPPLTWQNGWSITAPGTAPSLTNSVTIATKYLEVAVAGVVKEFAGSVLPAGHLWADGASYLVADYPRLHAAIGYTWGGSGANFNVPNRMGRVGVGRDPGQTEFDTLGETGGAKTHTLTEAQSPWRTSLNEASGYGLTISGSFQDRPAVNRVGGTATAAHNILQPYVAMNYIIKT